jgi:cag pathogenicity island protein 25
MFHRIHAAALDLAVRTVDQPSIDFSGPGTAALKKFSGQVLGFGVTLTVLGVIAGAILLILGFLNASKKFIVIGFTAVGCAILGGIIALNAANLVNWGSSFGLF